MNPLGDIGKTAFLVLYALSAFSLVALLVYRMGENWRNFLFYQRLLLSGLLMVAVAIASRAVERLQHQDQPLIWQVWLTGLGVILMSWSFLFQTDERITKHMKFKENEITIEDAQVYKDVLEVLEKSREMRKNL